MKPGPHCQTENFEGNARCKSCNILLDPPPNPQIMNCPDCSYQISRDAVLCVQYGPGLKAHRIIVDAPLGWVLRNSVGIILAYMLLGVIAFIVWL